MGGGSKALRKTNLVSAVLTNNQKYIMGNAFLGVFLHWCGGLASGSFYVPYRGVKKWSWETYWLVGGFFSWIICPWLFAYFMTNDLFGVLRRQSFDTLAWTYFFGLLWGLGGLTYGLTMRYLGLSLGTGVALGYCAAFGTLVPPIFKALTPNFFVFAGSPSIVEVAASTAGKVTLAGVAICLLGIAIAAFAGYTKEREMPEKQKKKSIKEFSFKKGILVATFCGIMSACFAFALQSGKSINAASLAAGTNTIWTGLPALPVLLLGGFTTNFIWCILLNIKNRSGYQYLATHVREEYAHQVGDGGEPGDLEQAVAKVPANLKIPVLPNYLFSALAGTTWYFQFFFYTMGATQMGKYDFASWTLHMSSIIIFATMWGWIFHEWKGSSKKAHRLIAGGIVTLVLATIVIGYGAWLKSHAGQ
jgi:L-rhamnose-H+ transport protein